MEELKYAVEQALGLGLDNRYLNAGHMSLRALVVFVAAVVMLRVGDKRFMGKSTALDVLLGIVFGSIVSRAITGNAPFFPTLAASLVLVLLHWVSASVAFRSHGFGRAVKGTERLLVRDGEIQWEAMKKAHITEHDLKEALRVNGKEPDVKQVALAHLERNGDVSITTRS
jgi:uncharacterized membrane protein YcaP (DUF421 family)